MYHVAVENDRSRLVTFGRAIATIRAAIGLTQAVLGRRIGRSQAYVSMLERGRLTSVRFTDAEAICRALGATLVFGVESPLLRSPTRQRDRAHAHCVAYVARRLEVNGWTVRREVEVGDPAWPGWVDVLAYHPATRTLLIVDVKTELHDVGDVERRLSWYERRAGAAAQSRRNRQTARAQSSLRHHLL